jgi:hypothetical protein
MLWTFAGLCLAVGLAQAGIDKKEAETCGSFGTSVEFVETPKEAAVEARKAEKLVFVLHVSGNFEDPRFT